MKILDGKELASFIKERQAREVRNFKSAPKLLIIRDSDSPVILKYVRLKIHYGEDIGATVEDFCAQNTAEIRAKIKTASEDPEIHGMILQLPLQDTAETDNLTALIAPEKDVDGLSGQKRVFDSATAEAILWLLAGYNIELAGKRIALVGRGKLVGAPLYKMLQDSHLNVSLFHRGLDLTNLKNYDIIVTATGVPGLITSGMISPGAVVVDAGTASENGILKGDVADEVRNRTDLTAITPKIGGVGPLTVACLFDHLLRAYKASNK